MNRTLWRLALLTGLLGGGLLACARTPAADPQRAALEAAIQRWVAAVNALDTAALHQAMTEDVELLDGASTVKGREASIQALRAQAPRGRMVEVTAEITLADDVAWHVAGLTRTRENGVLQAAGQALEIWKRVDGDWKLHRRMVTGSDMPDVSVTRPSTKEPVLDRRGE